MDNIHKQNNQLVQNVPVLHLVDDFCLVTLTTDVYSKELLSHKCRDNEDIGLDLLGNKDLIKTIYLH